MSVASLTVDDVVHLVGALVIVLGALERLAAWLGSRSKSAQLDKVQGALATAHGVLDAVSHVVSGHPEAEPLKDAIADELVRRAIDPTAPAAQKVIA